MWGTITGAITGGKNSKACFIAGTAVLTASGYTAIEKICAGDKVWAENSETGEKELKQVVQTFVKETDELVHVHVNGEEIRGIIRMCERVAASGGTRTHYSA